jgi:LAS superfamily LD-carboxypeptidase LdcB
MLVHRIVNFIAILSVVLAFATAEARLQFCSPQTLDPEEKWRPLGEVPSSQLATQGDLRALPRELVEERRLVTLDLKTLEALFRMANEARKSGIELKVASGYRSREAQQKLIDEKLASGVCPETLYQTVAPTKYSTHPTGRAIDFSPANTSFAQTPAYRWLKQNAAGFGFKETYSSARHHGIAWEPWHYDFTSP